MNGRMQRILLFVSLIIAAFPAMPAAAGGGCHAAGPGTARAVAGTTVDMEGMCFLPAVLAVEPGTTVRFTNDDDAAHVVVGTGWGTMSPAAPGEAVEHRFPDAGTYAYSCYLHPGMNGAIVVGQAAPPAATPTAASASAPAPAPAALATSSTAAGIDFRLLALGSLGGALFGGAAGRRLQLGRRRG